ncbi:MAG: hypothetical protein AB1638_08020 [Nitrospirota bacterium]
MKGKRKRAKKLLKKEKENMALKSVESQNVEFNFNLLCCNKDANEKWSRHTVKYLYANNGG